MIDCETFQRCEIDALYSGDGEAREARELDDEASTAMAEHAATCADCSARLAKLKRTRGLVLAVAIEAVPTDFESRIMAAVDAGMTKRASVIPIGRAAGLQAAASPSAPSASAAGAAKPDAGAKVVSLFSRPSFAVAATFVLVIGAGALLLTRSGVSMKSMAANDEAPSVAAASAASTLTPVPMPAENAPADPLALGKTTAAAAPTAMAIPPSVAVAPQAAPAAGALALNDEDKESAGSGRAAPAAKPAAIAAAPAAEPPASPRPAKAGKSATNATSSADARAFAAAKALYDAGRYAEALPKFDALSAQNPEADLYAARCVARTRGCAAAEARYDTAAQTNAGTETGSRAQLEGARCYQSTGDVVAARKRYAAAKDEGLLESEAMKALDELDATGGGGGAAGGAHAAPKAPAPRAPAPSQPSNR